MKLSYLDLTTTDPAFNLAVEEYVFETLPRDRTWLMLWQNDNAIIIGRHQNTLAQINEPYVRSRGIRVVRRLSGGGAVYHDLGNLNFTVIADAAAGQEIQMQMLCRPVVAALEKMGLRVELNGRNDMTVDGKKFSGNAQYVKDGRVMHHGTLLFDSDTSVLSQALQVDEEKIRAKGVTSVKSRVTNLRPLLPRDMTLAQFRQTLLETVLQQLPGQAYTLTAQDLSAIGALRRRYESWDWNYGNSPACSLVRKRRVEGCGTVEAYLELSKGRIQSLQLRGDFFGSEELTPLTDALSGCPLEQTALEQALADIPVGHYIHNLSAQALARILTGEA